MLRKIIHIALALLFLVSTMGVTISMHYCGDNLISMSVIGEAESCCGDDCGCCDNETIHLEVEDDYVSPLIVQSNASVELDVLFPVLFMLSAELSTEVDTTTKYFNDTSPPLTLHKRLSLLQTYLC